MVATHKTTQFFAFSFYTNLGKKITQKKKKKKYRILNNKLKRQVNKQQKKNSFSFLFYWSCKSTETLAYFRT